MSKIKALSSATPASAVHVLMKQLQSASLEHILDTVMEGVIIVDHNSAVQYMNPTAQQLVEFVSDSTSEVAIDQLLPLCDEPDSCLGNCAVEWPVTDVVERQVVYTNVANLAVRSDSGSLKHIAYSIAPISIEPEDNAEDSVVGAMITIRDIEEEKELMRLKSEFVSVVSHQLRTPASAVKWNLETLLDNRHGNDINDWQEEKLQQSYQSNERMISLINDLLNVSRLDDGQMSVEPQEVSMYQLVDQVAQELAQFAKANNVEIDNQIPDDDTVVKADVSKVREVIVNLLTNAIKYTQRGHHEVTITANRDKGGLVCAVTDHGIGIPKESMQHIFKKFYRADNAVESQTEGSGLGLYIARQIIRLHGGDLWIESTVGEGTTVSFLLPIAKA